MSKKLPESMVMEDRVYYLRNLFEDGEKKVSNEDIFSRAMKIKEYCDIQTKRKDGQYILINQDQIPSELRGRAVFVFFDWKNSENTEQYAYVFYKRNRWEFEWTSDSNFIWQCPTIVLYLES